MAELIALGMVKISEMIQWEIRSQVLTLLREEVMNGLLASHSSFHALANYGCSSQTKW
jgi:hypothetical protein